MENASKALIMAGGILIAILVVSLLVIGWNNITDYSRLQEEIQTAEQITTFNKEFESYNKGVVRGYELVSLANLVEDTNQRYQTIDGYKELEIFIKFLKGTTIIQNIKDEKIINEITESYIDLITFMETYYKKALEDSRDFAKIYKESYFQCDKIEYDGENEQSGGGSARVQKMYFTQIKKK